MSISGAFPAPSHAIMEGDVPISSPRYYQLINNTISILGRKPEPTAITDTDLETACKLWRWNCDLWLLCCHASCFKWWRMNVTYNLTRFSAAFDIYMEDGFTFNEDVHPQYRKKFKWFKQLCLWRILLITNPKWKSPVGTGALLLPFGAPKLEILRWIWIIILTWIWSSDRALSTRFLSLCIILAVSTTELKKWMWSNGEIYVENSPSLYLK